MQIWLNGKKPPFMDSEEKGDMNAEKILYAVSHMSYQGLQCMAVYGLLWAGKFESAAGICRDLESLKEVAGGCFPEWQKEGNPSQRVS